MAMKKLRRVWRACILASASWAGEGPWPASDERQQGEAEQCGGVSSGDASLM